MTQRPTPEEVAEWLVEENRRTAQIIRRHGVFIQYVGSDDVRRSTAFAYTVGLFGLGHPELLVLGLSSSTAGSLLNTVAERVRAGADLSPGQVLEFEEWTHRVAVEVLPNPAQILFAANSYYQRPDEASVPAYQLSYDDRDGRFPWDAGYDVPAWIQPRPGEFRA
ncbi:MAG: DUF4262 domain-containing protein [Actinobacteria bacterium]|nr:DUF4262 domain-containing protein [Actinomycetota bacterium]